jgi:hypothetical protein
MTGHISLTELSFDHVVKRVVPRLTVELDRRLSEIHRLLRDPVWLHDVDDDDPRVIRDCQAASDEEGMLRILREIGGEEDGSERLHGTLPVDHDDSDATNRPDPTEGSSRPTVKLRA